MFQIEFVIGVFPVDPTLTTFEFRHKKICFKTKASRVRCRVYWNLIKRYNHLSFFAAKELIRLHLQIGRLIFVFVVKNVTVKFLNFRTQETLL